MKAVVKKRKVIPLTPSTGAVLNADQVVGRSTEVSYLKEMLEDNSVKMYAVRRFGKSSILIKLKELLDGLPGFEALYLDVEGESSCDGFIEKLYREFRDKGLIKESAIKKIDKVFNSILDRIKRIGVASIMDIELNERSQFWKEKLEALMEAIIEENPDKTIVISLDEFSIMLDTLDPKEAIALIGILRAIMHHEVYKQQIRFVYCGSIGIDLVMDKLKKVDANIGGPLNHMYTFVLEPLTWDNAIYFAQCLNMGCKLDLSDELMSAICKRSEYIPYYIDAMFYLLRYKRNINGDTVEAAYMEMLDDSNEKFEFAHFYDRIDIHYPDKAVSFSILNILSQEGDWLEEVVIYKGITALHAIDRSTLTNELKRLTKDGYLERKTHRAKGKGINRFYKFKYQILKDWWEINKSY